MRARVAPAQGDVPVLVRGAAAHQHAAQAAAHFALRFVGGPHRMILLVNPRATRPKNRRFPLSVMAIGASLPASESWEIVDGNRPSVDPFEEVVALVARGELSGDPVRAIALSVMPGPQLVSAVPLTK